MKTVVDFINEIRTACDHHRTDDEPALCYGCQQDLADCLQGIVESLERRNAIDAEIKQLRASMEALWTKAAADEK